MKTNNKLIRSIDHLAFSLKHYLLLICTVLFTMFHNFAYPQNNPVHELGPHKNQANDISIKLEDNQPIQHKDTLEIASVKTEHLQPTNICSGKYYQCDSTAMNRWKLFSSSDNVNMDLIDSISVGKCSKNGVSSDKVQMLLALAEKEDDIYFSTKIRFYSDFDDYVASTKVSNEFPHIFQPNRIVKNQGSHLYIDFNDKGVYRYWIKHNDLTKNFYMVVYFGYRDTLLCELGKIS